MSKQTKIGDFSQESYDLNDKFAKDLFVEFIKKRGHEIVSTEETKFHDVITNKEDEEYYFELEVKTGYPFTTEDTFPFSTVSFLGRKERLHKKASFYYIIICRETEYAVGAHSDDIYDDTYLEKLNINTKERIGKDKMYRIPKNKCFFFNLK